MNDEIVVIESGTEIFSGWHGNTFKIEWREGERYIVVFETVEQVEELVRIERERLMLWLRSETVECQRQVDAALAAGAVHFMTTTRVLHEITCPSASHLLDREKVADTLTERGWPRHSNTSLPARPRMVAPHATEQDVGRFTRCRVCAPTLTLDPSETPHV